MYLIQIATIATCMANVAYTSLNIMSMDVPKQVFVWFDKFSQLFTVVGNIWEHFLRI